VHSANASTFKNAKHAAQWLASLENDVFPVFGDKLVNAIDSSDVLRALTPIWTTKPETARRLAQRIRVVLDWAKASGYSSGDNPVDGVTKVLPKVRPSPNHHAALAYVQIPTFLAQLRKTEAGESTRLALEFLILTATRTNEVLGARWEEIDRTEQTWTVPGGRMKAGQEHRIPLSQRCLELLDRADAIRSGEYVFPSRSPRAPLSNMSLLMLLRRMHRHDITVHGFRSTFRDWAAERTNAPREVAEAALAHVVKDKAEAAYRRTDLFERRRVLMESWTAFATARPAEVVSIRG
jgi:integrase